MRLAQSIQLTAHQNFILHMLAFDFFWLVIGPFKAPGVVAARYQSLTLKAALICLPDNNLGQSASPSTPPSSIAAPTPPRTIRQTRQLNDTLLRLGQLQKRRKLQAPTLRRICPLLLYSSVVSFRSKMESLGDSVGRAPAPLPVNLKSKQSNFSYSTDERNIGHGAADHQETERS